MTVAGDPVAKTDGSARELPIGRLRSFEDADAPDLATLLTRRSPRTQESPGPAAAQTDQGAPPGQGEETPPELPRRRVTRGTGRKPSTTSAGRDTGRKNRIRSSSVHVPSALIDRIIAERERSGRSNGEIIISALESAHDQMHQLIQRRDPTGGSLFVSRPSRGARLSDGPLTALNVRLYEADYDVIDELVEKFGAFSRGHLISAALTAYFDRGRAKTP